MQRRDHDQVKFVHIHSHPRPIPRYVRACQGPQGQGQRQITLQGCRGSQPRACPDLGKLDEFLHILHPDAAWRHSYTLVASVPSARSSTPCRSPSANIFPHSMECPSRSRCKKERLDPYLAKRRQTLKRGIVPSWCRPEEYTPSAVLPNVHSHSTVTDPAIGSKASQPRINKRPRHILSGGPLTTRHDKPPEMSSGTWPIQVYQLPIYPS